MNHQKLAMLIAICFIFSTGVTPVDAQAATQQVKSQVQVSQKSNLPLKTSTDTIAPTLSNVGISSSSNSSSTKVGDKITLTFASSEDLAKNPTITILGNKIVDSNIISKNNTYTATYTLEYKDLEGIVTFNISDVDDKALNKMSPANISQTNIDKKINFINPILSEVTVNSNNKNTSYAKIDDTVILKFTTFSALAKKPVVIINGVCLNENCVTQSKNTYTATCKLTNSNTEGLITFSINQLQVIGGAISINNITSVTSGPGVTFYKSSPVLSDVWVDSNNSDTTVKSGDTIHLNFTTNRQLDLVSTSTLVTIFGQTVKPKFYSSRNSKYTYVADYTLKDTDPENITFNILNLTDLAGNINASNITAITDGENIKHDKIPPVISNVTFTSNNQDPTLAKPNDVVTLKFDTDGTESGDTNVTIAGHNVLASKEANTNHYTAKYTLDGNTSNGKIAYDFNGIMDEAGNIGVPSTPNNDIIFFNATSPTFTDIKLSATNNIGIHTTYPHVSDTINLTFTSSEDLAPNQFVTINGHYCEITTDSEKKYSARYVLTQSDTDIAFNISSLLDAAGNKSAIYTTTTDGSYLILDKTSPTITISGVLDNEFNNNGSTSAVITFTDKNFDLNSNITTINGNDISKYITKISDGIYSYTFTATREGKYVIKASGKDFSQNVATKTLTFTIDRTKPVITINVNKPYVNTAFTPKITTGSSDDIIEKVLINGVSFDPHNLPMLSVNQQYVIGAVAKDKAGNISTPAIVTFILDTIKPKINVSGLIQSFFYASDVNPNITFEDLNLLNSSMTLNGSAYTNKTISKEGVYDLKLFSSDKADNINEQLIHFVIDKSSPSIEFKYPLNNKTFNTMIKPLLITQSKYGLDTISMFLDGEVYHGESIIAEGKHTLIVTAKNKSGKTTQKTFTFFIKTTPPVIRITNVMEGRTYKKGIIPEVYKEEAVKYEMTLNGKPYVYGLAIDTEGPYTLVIKATDTADNVATKTIHFKVENKTLASAIKALKTLDTPHSILPIIGGFIALCIGGLFTFIKFRPRKKDETEEPTS